MTHNGKRYCAGVFDDEKHAAMKLNLLCDKFGIQRKNSMIDIEFDAIRQVTHPLCKIFTFHTFPEIFVFHEKAKSNQSKAENIGNGKEVKVEEENILYGLKDQCENNFMKKSCQSQKRKRKEDSTLNDIIV